MNGQCCGHCKASSALSCTGTLKIMPPSFQSLHRLVLHYFGNDGFVSANLANCISLLFVSTSVYSGAKFSLNKMKKVESCLLVTPLSILCINKKCSELFYNQPVRIHTKDYMQKSQQTLKRSFSSTHSQPDLHSHTQLQLGKYLLLCFGTTTNTWLGQDFSLPTHRGWGSHFGESVCAHVYVCVWKNLNSHQNAVHL